MQMIDDELDEDGFFVFGSGMRLDPKQTSIRGGGKVVVTPKSLQQTLPWQIHPLRPEISKIRDAKAPAVDCGGEKNVGSIR